MGLDLGKIDQSRTRWLALGGHLSGVEVLIRNYGPLEQEKWRQGLIRVGVLQKSEGIVFNPGRESDFFKAFAERHVLDWRGDIKPEGTAYDAEKMAAVMAQYRAAWEQVATAVAEEADFFSENGNASPT